MLNEQFLRGKPLLKSLLSVFLTTIWLAFGSAAANAAEITKPKGVVELFTSQGCSSCPPADEFLAKLADEREVLALSWHVDYWDYLGWKDIFASPANTQRQRRYAASMKERQIYTPQAVINGQAHVVGSRGNAIRSLITSQEASGAGLTVPINASLAGDSLTVNIPASSTPKRATLWLVYFNNASEVAIGKGENRGRKITYRNVVGDIQMLGMIKSAGLNLELPVSELKRQGFDSYALLLQTADGEGNPGPIIGAAIISDL